jgi:MscS family membrane protein
MTDAINEIAQASELALSNGDRLLQIGLIAIAGGVTFLGGIAIVPILKFLLSWFAPQFLTETYMRVMIASKSVILTLITLSAMEVMLFLIPETEWLSLIEFCLSVSITIIGGRLLSKLFRDFFDTKILGVTFASNPKVRGESIFLLRYLGDFAIAITLILFFCISHDINVVGIAASLGIGGIAIAFAAQKTLEQFLGGIVLTLDRPFTVGDYIGLPDGQMGKQGTFGRVESIGLRSTKIRTSGKGTLTIIPNNSLTQTTIENFSGAKKVMSVMTIAFQQKVSIDEQALIRQIIMDSTVDIFGLDWRSTEVAFGENNAQISFFILGSNELSMELRRQLLDLATQQITKQLKNQDISFTLDEPKIYVDSPISI